MLIKRAKNRTDAKLDRWQGLSSFPAEPRFFKKCFPLTIGGSRLIFDSRGVF
jgi:hypothetical protein